MSSSDPAPAAGHETAGEAKNDLDREVRELKDRLEELKSSRFRSIFGAPPIGAVVAYAGQIDENFQNREGWMLCDGRPLKDDQSNHDLFLAIGTIYGRGLDQNGQQVGDFNLPDYRGYFLRGVDAGARRDADRAAAGAERSGVGSTQTEAFKEHNHSASGATKGNPFSSTPTASSEWKSGFAGGSAFSNSGQRGVSRNALEVTVTVDNAGATETRPINVAVHWIIKFKS
jgi:microcystin-dependent protein